jgi:S-DNA-T family DNA segregation ATPase FtsK/SpoIIIE
MKQAAAALQWAVSEMERRYQLFADSGARSLASYNARPSVERLPSIVIVVDEFADLMMQEGKTVRPAVARLAQKARASGIHVILATQRPSVEVIPGDIQANFPSRIAFRVAKAIDSRIVLDEQGAEHLLGNGDMLVKLNGAETKRVQCPWVSEDDVQRVTSALRAQGEPVYDNAILQASAPAPVNGRRGALRLVG